MSHVVQVDALVNFLKEMNEIDNERSELNEQAAGVREEIKLLGQNPAMIAKTKSLIKAAKKDKDPYDLDEVTHLISSMWDIV